MVERLLFDKASNGGKAGNNARRGLLTTGLVAPPPRVKPMTPMGVSGVSVLSGYVRTTEKNADWVGTRKWQTIADLSVNVSIVAASVGFFLNMVAHPQWHVSPAEDKGDGKSSKEAEKLAEFVEEVMHDMTTPWQRVVRRSAMYRFNGFGIQEWIAKKRDDGKIGIQDIEPRPPFTIERWAVDDDGTLLGVWQRSPQTFELLGLPRGKLIYLVDDTYTDQPDGLGVYRMLGEPFTRLKQYLELEARAYERDMRGIPVGRAPISVIKRMVKEGRLTQIEGESLLQGLKDFITTQVRDKNTSILMDSMPYENQTADGLTIAGQMQWDVNLLSGGVSGLSEMASAIDRLQREMARIIGTEHLMMGDAGGNRALSQDKSRNLYLIANAVLANIADTMDHDLIDPLWSLNGFDPDLKPYFSTEDVAFKDAQAIAAALAQMATAGAVLQPDDPAIDDVRDLLGISKAPPPTPAQLGAMQGVPPGGPAGAPPVAGGPGAQPGGKKPAVGAPAGVGGADGKAPGRGSPAQVDDAKQQQVAAGNQDAKTTPKPKQPVKKEGQGFSDDDEDVEKYNEAHDARGRFTFTTGSGQSGTELEYGSRALPTSANDTAVTSANDNISLKDATVGAKVKAWMKLSAREKLAEGMSSVKEISTDLALGTLRETVVIAAVEATMHHLMPGLPHELTLPASAALTAVIGGLATKFGISEHGIKKGLKVGINKLIETRKSALALGRAMRASQYGVADVESGRVLTKDDQDVGIVLMFKADAVSADADDAVLHWLRGLRDLVDAYQPNDATKYNPFHDEAGRFASGDSSGGGTTISSDIPGSNEGGGGAKNYGLIPGDVAKFHSLKNQWAQVNNDLLAHIDRPDSPEAQASMREMERISKEIGGLHADPGGPEGIGLPGGPRDVTIVGAGPGGLAASIFGGAEGLDTLVVEKNVEAGGQARYSSRIENFPGFPVGVAGDTLTSNMFEQSARLGAENKLGVAVTGMTYDPATGMKTLTLSNGETIDSRTVILAGGVEFRQPDFAGADGPGVFVGDGKALTASCVGGSAVVLGGSNGAAQAALGAATTADHVTLISRSPLTKNMSDYQVSALANQPKITVIEGDNVASLNRDAANNPVSITTTKGQTIPCKAIGVFAGSVPMTDWLPASINRDTAGRVSTTKSLETSMPGVFAVGDMREGAIGRIGVAVGEGQLALREAHVYLEDSKKQQAKLDNVRSDVTKVGHRFNASDLLTRLFALDRVNPYFGTTIEGVKPVKKFNQNHDATGRFSSGGDGGGGHPGEGYSAGAKLVDGKIYTSNVDDAARALSEDREVVLSQPHEVATLLDKLAAIGRDAVAKGEKAPTYDLCNVSVEGTNLFCAQSLGIPRIDMPQLSGKPLPGSKANSLPKNSKGEVNLSEQFSQHCSALGRITDETVDASHLRASQNELNGGKVAGIYGAMGSGTLPAGDRLFISRDDYIIDGHHRWAAAVTHEAAGTAGISTKIDVRRVDIDTVTLLDEAKKFAKDWGLPQMAKRRTGAVQEKGIAEIRATMALSRMIEPTLKWFVNTGYRQANNLLRGKTLRKQEGEYAESEMAKLDAALASPYSKTPTPMLVYRGITAEFAKRLEEALKGDGMFSDQGYIVASLVARNTPYQMQIELPAGTSYLSLNKFLINEIVLPHGSRLQATAYHELPQNRIRIVAHWLGT